MPLDELAEGFRTLQSPDTDRALAVEELSGSPFFRELLISADGRTAALRVELIPLPVLERENTAERRRQLAERAALIEAVRGVRAEFSDRATLHLGGVPMIAADMIAFVKSDLAVFGGLVLVLVMAVLYAAFRQLRWVVLPLGAAAASIVATMGALGFLYKPATVISSNFVALLAIMTISLNIHLIVRYRELAQAQGAGSVRELVAATMTSKFSPCLYTALTTMAAFGSLTASRIVPVEDFGLMMCIGVLFALLIAFTLFPAVLMLLPRGRPKGGHPVLGWHGGGLEPAGRAAVRRCGGRGRGGAGPDRRRGRPVVRGQPLHRLLQGRYRHQSGHGLHRPAPRWHRAF